MTDDQPEPDVFEAYARLRGALATETRLDDWSPDAPPATLVTVNRDDLRAVLDVPLAHALTDEAVRLAVGASRKIRGSWPLTERQIRAAIVAALGVPEAP